jgi:hypothetical protein
MRAPASRRVPQRGARRPRHGGLQAVEHLRAGHGEAVLGQRLARQRDPAVGQDLVRQHRVAHRRVMAQTVSSVDDRGRAPSSGVSRAVFLKPTMPHSAAGMRIEPPVSEPRPMKAAPAATETARRTTSRPGRAASRDRPDWRACRGAG